MKTSVIISVYNRSDLLLRCLKSLNNQSLLPDEIVLTDDGSTEDIVSILEQSEEDYKFSILYCKQSDIGFRLARCKNNGVRESNGDIMIFLDQDIVTTKNYIKTI
ncbi:MAG: glycosyltransferase, partial [Candidatus Zophobacter franzmannii]|nr:glycosyltransferase [Candidatus Zophobacter franzmannii]